MAHSRVNSSGAGEPQHKETPSRCAGSITCAWNPSGHRPGTDVPGTTVPIVHAMGLTGQGSIPVRAIPRSPAEIETDLRHANEHLARMTRLFAIEDPVERYLVALRGGTRRRPHKAKRRTSDSSSEHGARS